MDTTEVTERTTAAIRKWANLADTTPVLLNDVLDKFRLNARNDLRVKVNVAFTGQSGFPIGSAEWQQLDPKDVRTVRDDAQKRVEGGAT